MPSSSAIAKAKKKGQFYEPSSHPKQQPVTPAERVEWAYDRYVAAMRRSDANPQDRALAVATDARRAEYESAKHTLTCSMRKL